MGIVPYTHLNHVLSNYRGSVTFIPTDLTFTVEEYVKAQLHFPLVPYVHNRSLEDYKKAYEVVIDGARSDDSLKAFYKVLRYYYRDIGTAIINTNNSSRELGFEFYMSTDLKDVLPKKVITSENVGDYVEESDADKEPWLQKAIALVNLSDESKSLSLIEMR